LFVDERCVPADDPQSNFGMVCRTLLDHVPVPYGQIHRVAGEKEPAQAAADYERLLLEAFPKGPDLVLLGMGADGHTASLFPGTDALAVTDRMFVANYVPQISAWRLTMTVAYLNRAFDTLVLVSGASKAEMVNEVLVGMGQPARYPIQRIQPASGRLVWMMDAPAAGMDAEEDFADESESGERDEEGSD
jgi:6-phosphogluconolactonase